MPHSSAVALMRRLNYFKKLPEDLTISTTSGTVMTIVGVVMMAVLFLLEFRAFLAVKVETAIEVDDTVDTLMRVNFNITVDDAPCEFVSVDLTDATGTYEHNVTRHITKTRLTAWRRHIAIHPEDGAGMPDYVQPDDAVPPLEDGAALDRHGNPVGQVVALSEDSLTQYVESHDMVFVNFFAPWCHWCRELEPIWSQTAAKLPDLHYGEHVKVASVDCVEHTDFCRRMNIRAFPTLTLYSDHTMEHALLYRSTRSVEAFLDFLENNAQRHHVSQEAHAAEMAKHAIPVSVGHGAEGCMVVGHLLVKKVPGTFHVKLHSLRYSHSPELVNASHVVHALSFGGATSDANLYTTGAFLGVGASRAENMAFATADAAMSFVHYHKVVSRVREYASGERVGTYTYTMHTSSFAETDDRLPSIKFKYDLSPLKVRRPGAPRDGEHRGGRSRRPPRAQVVERETATPIYHFITSACAIIGGFFTLLSLAESSLHYSIETISKKLS